MVIGLQARGKTIKRPRPRLGLSPDYHDQVVSVFHCETIDLLNDFMKLFSNVALSVGATET